MAQKFYFTLTNVYVCHLCLSHLLLSLSTKDCSPLTRMFVEDQQDLQGRIEMETGGVMNAQRSEIITHIGTPQSGRTLLFSLRMHQDAPSTRVKVSTSGLDVSFIK